MVYNCAMGKTLTPWNTRFLTTASAIAALYAALALLCEPISYGPIQCRISEVLTVLPIITPAAIPGLFAGCLLTNMLGPYGLPDIILGSLCTLLAALGTHAFRHTTCVALLFPVMVNALGISLYLHFLVRMPFTITAASILASEAIVVFGPGMLVLLALKKLSLSAEPAAAGQSSGRRGK
jgi:uncharacterized membrane protein